MSGARLRIAAKVSGSMVNPSRQIRPPADEIDHLARRRIEQQGINGEVAPQRVLPGIVLEPHALRMPPIRVLEVAAEGGHFHLRPVLAHQHDPEVRPHLARAGKQSQQLRGRGRAGDVEVLRNPAQQQVAHAPAHQKGPVPRGAQPFHDRVRQLPGIHCSHANLAAECVWQW